jgi:hypothetical protein
MLATDPSPTPAPRSPIVTLTPGLTLLGLVLVLVSIPLAFSFAPFVIGVILLVYGARRAHLGLALDDGPVAA